MDAVRKEMKMRMGRKGVRFQEEGSENSGGGEVRWQVSIGP